MFFDLSFINPVQITKYYYNYVSEYKDAVVAYYKITFQCSIVPVPVFIIIRHNMPT